MAKTPTTREIIKTYHPIQQKAWRRIQYKPNRKEQVSSVFTREVVIEIFWRLFRQIRTLLAYGYVDFQRNRIAGGVDDISS